MKWNNFNVCIPKRFQTIVVINGWEPKFASVTKVPTEHGESDGALMMNCCGEPKLFKFSDFDKWMDLEEFSTLTNIFED
jgi:hypothetical protein